mgnify:CR=1 FL=1
MGKEITLENRDRLVQLGITIAVIRKMRGLSQEQLAEKANVSRTFIGYIEAPGLVKDFTVGALFAIADALDVNAADLIGESEFPDRIINKGIKKS